MDEDERIGQQDERALLMAFISPVRFDNVPMFVCDKSSFCFS
jgi:hypothetical protein